MRDRFLQALAGAFAVLLGVETSLGAEILFPPLKTAVETDVISVSGKTAPGSPKVYWQQIRPGGIQANETQVSPEGFFSFSATLDPGVNNITVEGQLVEVYYDNGQAPMPSGYYKRRAHAGDVSACEDCHESNSNKLLSGGFPEVCLGCHVVTSQNPVNNDPPMKYSHFRTVNSNCGSCHDAHYSENRKLVKRDRANPCESCHSQKYASKQSHPAFDEGGCAACHDTHYSGYPMNLNGLLPSVCHQCHDQASKVVPAKFHPPSARNKTWCVECHDPHGTAPKLVRAATPAKSCLTCHANILKAGHGKDLEACGSCHDPHREIDSGLLKKNFPAGCEECHTGYRTGKTVHPPVEDGCQSCHNPHSADNVKRATELCATCHNFSKDKQLSALHGDLEMTIPQCLKCHPVHVSNEAKLVRSKTHFPLTQGKCDACHGAGAQRAVKIGNVSDRCGKCHSVVRDLAAKNATVHEPVADNCTECHDPHMSPNKSYLKKPVSKLCVECHDVVTDKDGRKIHPAAETCTDCHMPHGGENKKFLAQKPPKLCFECHDDPAKKGKNVHPALEEGCVSCHNGHSGFGKGFLQKKLPGLCFDCHDDPAKKGVPVHPALDEGCTACHTPHASDQKKLFTKKVDAICLDCHTDPRKDKANVHPALDDGCTTCHNGHISKSGKLLLRPVNEICADCHSGMKNHHVVKAEVAKDFPGGGFPVVGKELSCVGCHNPHASNEKSLFAKPEKTFCSTCH